MFALSGESDVEKLSLLGFFVHFILLREFVTFPFICVCTEVFFFPFYFCYSNFWVASCNMVPGLTQSKQ